MMMVADPLDQVGASSKLVERDRPFPPLGVGGLLKLVDGPLSCVLVVGACRVGGKLVVVDLKKGRDELHVQDM
jgi:hypothetical protein